MESGLVVSTFQKMTYQSRSGGTLPAFPVAFGRTTRRICGSHRFIFYPRNLMKRSSAYTILRRTGGIAALLALVAGKAAAQATITGKVTDTDGQPLGGAQVVIRELASFGANTASNGTYTIEVPADRARGQSMTLVARFLGKSPATRAITLNAGRQEIDFRLRDDPLRLDELVVTGVNEATSTKKLPFAVGRVSADQLQETPAVSALGGLAGKVAGVRVVQSPVIRPGPRASGSAAPPASRAPRSRW